MDEIQQFKCLTDLREVISQLGGYYARPVLNLPRIDTHSKGGQWSQEESEHANEETTDL